MILSFRTNSPEQTQALGELIGRLAEGPLALLLSGEYGSGKTTFVQGLAAGLGISGAVRSPSYNIVRHYGDGRLPLVHADLYRAATLPEVDELGLDELSGPRGVVAVEWPGALSAAFDAFPCLRLSFSFEGGAQDDSQRRIELDCPDNCPAELKEGLLAAAA